MSIVTVSGNIGSGKTTCLKFLESQLQQTTYSVCYEPLHEWIDWLQKFYKEPKKYVFGFQVKVLLSFLYFQDRSSQFCITERCPLDSVHIFSTNSLNNHLLDKSEFDIIQELSEKVSWIPDIYIYIRTSPDICLQRIGKRARACETSVTLTYLKEIHDLYEEHVNSFYKKQPSTRVFIVDGDQEISVVQRQIMEIVLDNTKNA